MAASSSQNQDCQWVNQILKKRELALREENVRRPKLPIVPKILRDEGDDKDYIPQFVSLGPYHHGKDSLQIMEGHKYRALHHAMNRSNHEVLTYLNSIKEVEEEARACYEGNISLSSKEFVEMMVVDGIFILEIFRGLVYSFPELGYALYDQVFNVRWIRLSIQRDMILLENQIPLFVLDKILAINPDPNSHSVAWFAVQFFNYFLPITTLPTTYSGAWDSPPQDELLHCLDVFWHILIGHITIGYDDVFPTPFATVSHCVTELQEVGIKFKRRYTNRFWGIKFENGVLEIPTIIIDDCTKSVFLNLFAFEQCHPDRISYITSYIVFMNDLIKSDKDVKYLRDDGIIINLLGNDAMVADVFNTVCNGVFSHAYETSLLKTACEVDEYYRKKWNTWKAILKRDYFGNPWSVVSLIAAVILLVLTFLQTIFTVYPYFKPRS